MCSVFAEGTYGCWLVFFFVKTEFCRDRIEKWQQTVVSICVVEHFGNALYCYAVVQQKEMKWLIPSFFFGNQIKQEPLGSLAPSKASVSIFTAFQLTS